MGKGFGELYKLQSVVFYKISPFEIKAFHGVISQGFPRTIRRIASNFFYAVPPLAVSYMIYDWAEKENKRLMLKNPADFENDQ